MRTTITIDDALLEDLKSRAAERGTTVSRLIEDSVRLAAAPPRASESGEFELVTYGQGGRFTGVNKTSVVLETEDLERYGRRDR